MSDDRDLAPDLALIALATALRSGEKPADAITEWFCRSVQTWLDGTPIEQALGVRKTSEYARRDAALRRAARHCQNSPTLLAEAIQRHQRRRALNTPLDLALRDAFAAGRKIPSSARQLQRILDKKDE